MKRVDDADPLEVSGWDSMLREHHDGWRDKDYVQLAALFRLRRLSGSLLDVGCAVGDGFDVLRRGCRPGTQLSGCDFSEEGIRTAASRFPAVSLFVHDITDQLPGRWSTVISLQTIEHLDDPLAAVAAMNAAATRVLIVAAPYRNRRPDRDHRWSFDERDFGDTFDGRVLDHPMRNIYWYRSSVPGLVRGSTEVRARALAAGLARRARRQIDRVRSA